MKKLATLIFLVTLGCGKSYPDLSRFAAAGHTNPDAPVQANLHTVISARPAVIWQLLTDAKQWPAWNAQIEHVEATGLLQQGTAFQWKTGGTSIESHVQLAVENKRLAWTGTALTLKAIHVWQLIPESDGHTIVQVQESVEGLLATRMLSSAELADTDEQWLAALKRVAEVKARS